MPARRSVLHQHADLIQDLVGKGKTNREILDALHARAVKTSLEAVRLWVRKNAPPELLKHRSKGRRRKPDPIQFEFLPDHREEMRLPPFLEAFLKLFTGPPDSWLRTKSEIAEAWFGSAGIRIDLTLPPSEWVVPAQALSGVSDFELMLLAFSLSDHRGDPPGRATTRAYRSWLRGLMRSASLMRAKIRKGKDFTFSEIQ